MATFTPASDAWVLCYDQFGRTCWQNKQTLEIRYGLPGQGLALPPWSCAPVDIPTAQAFPIGKPQGFGQGVQFHASPFKAPEPKTALPVSVEASTKPGPSPPVSRAGTKPVSSTPVSRAEEAKQWSLKSDSRGKEYYFNSVTGESQFAKPDCLKKYTCRR